MAIVNKKSSKYLCFVSWSIRGRSTHRSWSPHGYDHNSFDLHFDTGTVPLIPILQIKDPNDHAPLILQPMFVGTFEQFVVIWAAQSLTISSLSLLSLFAFLSSWKLDPFTFPKIFTNWSAFSLSQMFTPKYVLKHCSSKNIGLCQNFNIVEFDLPLVFLRQQPQQYFTVH